MDKAYVWLFKYLPYEKLMEEDIADNEEYDFEPTVYKKNCKVCDKTGRVKIENSVGYITCPQCFDRNLTEQDKIINKANKAIIKNWLKIIANFREAQSGNIKAIKKFIKIMTKDLLLDDNWFIVKVKSF